MKGERRREILKALWDADKRCHWCLQFTRFIEDRNPANIVGSDATLDHLYQKGDPRREAYGFVNMPHPVVLACRRCNSNRHFWDKKLANRATDELLMITLMRRLVKWKRKLNWYVKECSRILTR